MALLLPLGGELNDHGFGRELAAHLRDERELAVVVHQEVLLEVLLTDRQPLDPLSPPLEVLPYPSSVLREVEQTLVVGDEVLHLAVPTSGHHHALAVCDLRDLRQSRRECEVEGSASCTI